MLKGNLILISILFICLNISAIQDKSEYNSDRIYPNFKADSVEAVWRDKSQDPEDRLEAALQLILKKYKNISLDSAINIARQQLDLAISVNNKYHQVQALRSLGIANFYLGRHSISLKYFERSLKVARDSDNKYLEAQTLWNIGDHYSQINMLSFAMNYYHESMKIHKSLGNELSSKAVLKSIADVYI